MDNYDSMEIGMVLNSVIWQSVSILLKMNKILRADGRLRSSHSTILHYICQYQGVCMYMYVYTRSKPPWKKIYQQLSVLKC